MRKLVLAGLTLTVAFAMAAVAIAQYSAAPVINSTLKITPKSKSGSKTNPKNALVNTVFTVNEESNSTLRRIEYTIPKNVKLNGAGFKKCSVAFINANGDDNCPKGSKVGTGAATALLGPQKSQLNFNVEVYVAGTSSLSLYLQTNLFNIAIPATIKNQIVAFNIPERVQRPVSGLYSYVTSVTANLGRQTGIPATTTVKKTVRRDGKKRTIRVKRYFASLQGCPKGGHVGGVKAFLAANPNPPVVPFLEDRSTSACTK